MKKIIKRVLSLIMAVVLSIPLTQIVPVEAASVVDEIFVSAQMPLESTGKAIYIFFNGTGLERSIKVAAFENDIEVTSGETRGQENNASCLLNFPANTTAADKIYTIKVSFDNGVNWEAKTFTVTVSKSNPVVSVISAAKDSLSSSGGNNNINISGTGLAGKIIVAAFEKGAVAISGAAIGTDTRASYIMAFPANTTESDKNYTIKVSFDNGVTWNAKTCTVTVSKAENNPAVSGISAANVSLSSSGGINKIKISGTNLGKTFQVAAFEDIVAVSSGIVTEESGYTYDLLFPSNTTAVDKVYTIKVSFNQGLKWIQAAKPCTVTVKGKEDTSLKAEINPTSKTFPSKTVGYSQVEAQQFSIKNTGTDTITGLSASLGTGNFDISTGISAKSISGSAIATVSVKPADGLSVGTYTDTLTISGDNNFKITAKVSFTVSKKSNGGSSGNGSSSPVTSGKITVDVKGDKEAPVTGIKTVDNEVANKVFTAEELNQIKNGADAAVYVEVQNIEQTVPVQDKTAVEQAIQELIKKDSSRNSLQVGRYLDISLFKKIGISNPIQMYETKGTIAIQIEIPQELRADNRDYMILRVHDGKADLINGSYDSKTGMFSFETDKFSTYALVYTEKGAETATAEKMILQLKGTAGKTSNTLTWKKAENADGYMIYGSKCGTDMVKLKTITNGSTTSYKNTKLKAGSFYKYRVKAYRFVDGKQKIIATSKSVHIVTTGGKYDNPSKVTLNVSEVSVSAGKTQTVKASVTAARNKKLKHHIAEIRYESGNPAIATVSANGKIKGISKGNCIVYVYAQNGLCKQIKVTVK